MAGTCRRTTSYIKEELLQNGNTFSFFQAIRLLRHLNEKKIKVIPNLSLSFQTSSIEEIKEDEDNFTIIANILGLYGTGSPLPTFYTEELIEEERRDKSFVKGLIDIINQRLYELLFDGWSKYKSMIRTIEEKDETHIQRLYSFAGIAEKELRQDIKAPYFLLRYTGLLSQSPRSASGLCSLLSDAFPEIKIKIIQCLTRSVKIPDDQKPRLGEQNCSLGKNIYVCKEAKEGNRLRIRLGPFTEKVFREFLPGTKKYNKLVFLTKYYLQVHFVFDIEAVITKNQINAVCLGSEKWSKLGLNTWMFSGEKFGEVRSVFYPEH